MTPELQRLLDSLPADQRIDFARLCEALYTMRFTGCTPIHWQNGVPRQIDFGAPIRLSIVQGGIDKPPPSDQG